MPQRHCAGPVSMLALIVFACGLASAWSQGTPAAGDGATQPAEENRVVIQREAMRLIDPKRYQVALVLEPTRKVTVAAPVSGRVQSVLHKTGDRTVSGTSTIRLENTEQELILDQAKANLKVAEIELRRAKTQADTDLIELAEARHAAADAVKKLAEYRLARTNIRVPFDGEIARTYVSQGQMVRAGDPLHDYGDPTQLHVEIPIDRKKVQVKQKLQLTIEEDEYEGTVENVLPLADRFGPLRDLVQSLASAIVVIDNKDGRLRPGQLVDVPVMPRNYVSQIPNASLSNLADGGRKVQVVRNGVIRDITVKLLGPQGINLSYVSGSFAPTDELIVSTSQELADGTQIRAATVAATPKTSKAGGTTSTKRPTRRGGF